MAWAGAGRTGELGQRWRWAGAEADGWAGAEADGRRAWAVRLGRGCAGAADGWLRRRSARFEAEIAGGLSGWPLGDGLFREEVFRDGSFEMGSLATRPRVLLAARGVFLVASSDAEFLAVGVALCVTLYATGM